MPYLHYQNLSLTYYQAGEFLWIFTWTAMACLKQPNHNISNGPTS